MKHGANIDRVGAGMVVMTPKQREMDDLSASSSDLNEGTLTDRDYQDQADFRYALRRFLRSSEEEARVAGVTPQQFQALLAVRGNPAYPEVTIGDVAEWLQIRHFSASLLVDRCVKRGLFTRQEDPNDRRRVLVSLTPDGEQILGHLIHYNRRQLRALEANLFRDTLRQALQAYESIRSADEGAPRRDAAREPTAHADYG